MPVGTSEALGAAATITVLTDIDDAVGISVPSYVDLTIDFAGHEYILTGPGAGSANTETQGFQLLKDSTIVMKAGTVRIAENANNIKRIIQNYSNLTLTNMIFYSENQVGGEDYCLSFNNGTVTISGTTSIIASDDAGDDVIAFDVYYWASGYPNGTSVVFDDTYTGTITGVIVYDTTDSTKASLEINGSGTFGGVTLSSDAESLSTDPEITITGGTFGNDVTDYLDETLTQDEDGKVVDASAVAKIGEVEYYSLASAFAAAVNGDTITLISDVTLNAPLVYENSASVTLELAGYTITFAYDSNGNYNGTVLSDGAWGLKVAAGSMTIQDTTGNGGIVTADENTYVDPVGASAGASLTITSGYYYTNSIYEAVVFAAGEGTTVSIEGGTFENAASYYKYDGGDALVLNIGNGTGATITVSGGTFIGRSPAEGDDNDTDTGETFVSDDYAAVSTGDGVYTVVEAETVAVVTDSNGNSTSYTSLNAVTTALAKTGLSGSYTVTMANNSYNSPLNINNSDLDVTLDLNGYSINMSSTASYPRTPVTLTAGSLTIKDSSSAGTGTIAAGENSSQGAVYNTGGALTIESGTYKIARTYTAAVVTDGTGASTSITGGEFHGNSYALQIGAGSLNIEDGKFYAAVGEAITVGTTGEDESTTAGTAGSCIMARNDSTAAAAVTISGGSFKCGTTYVDTTESSSDTVGQAIISTGGSGSNAPDIYISGGMYSGNRYNSVKKYLVDGYALSNIESNSEDYSNGYRYEVSLSDYLLGYYDESGEFVLAGGYTTAKAALADVDETNNVVVINTDSEITSTISVPEGTTVTIDLNGCTINTTGSSISVGIGADVTIIDSKVSATVTSSVGQAGVVRNAGGKLTIEGGIYTQTSTNDFVFAVYTALASGTTIEDDSNVSTTINGGTFVSETGYAFGSYMGTLTVTGGSVNAKSVLYATSSVSVDQSVTGGYYSVDPSAYVADGYAAYSYDADPYVYEVAKVRVAQIGSTYYTTLEEAFAAAADGDTITLLTDTELSASITVTSGTITLDLAGYTVSRAESFTATAVFRVNGANLTIKDSSSEGTGTIDAGDSVSGSQAVRVLSGSATLESGTLKGIYTVYINGGTFTATGGKIIAYDTSTEWSYGINMLNGSTVNISGDTEIICNNTSCYGAGIYIRGASSATTLNISGGTISGTTYGISGNGSYDNTVINITGGTITGSSTSGVGMYLPQYGTTTIDATDGDIYISGVTGIDICDGVLTIGQTTDSEYSIYITGYGPDTSEGKTGDGSFGNGAAVSICDRADYGTPYVTIYSGNFTGCTDTGAIAAFGRSGDEYTDWDDVSTYVNISGGTYSSEVDSEYCAEGYVPATLDETTGLYTVVTAACVASITDSEGKVTEYTSLNAAVSAAADGDTIVLLADIEINTQVVVSKSVTIDLAGYTVSRGDDLAYSGLIAVSGGALTITDSSDPSTGTIDAGTVFTNSSGGTSLSIAVQIVSGSAKLESGTLKGFYAVYAYGASSSFEATGGSITANEYANNYTYGIYMAQGADVTLSGDVTVTANSETGDGCAIANFGGNSDDTTTLNISENAVITGSTIGISTNGAASASNYCGNTEINISGGTITGSYGLYLPAVDSTTTISGGTIIGIATGIEIRAGSLYVTGGSIEGQGSPSTTQPNGNGTTVTGAGISVSQHTTKQEIIVEISGDAEIKGYTGIYELNTNADTSTAGSVTIAITEDEDGNVPTVTGTASAVYSASLDADTEATGAYTNSVTDINISAGIFSSEVDPEYCADGYTPATYDEAEGAYTVKKFFIGKYGTDGEAVPATLFSDEGENTIYIKVSSDNISAQSLSNDAYPTTSLKTSSGNSYVFAGWYEDSAGTTACTSMPASDAYAKFVDADVMKIYCVYTPVSIASTGNFWRFISSMDSKNYSSYQIVVTDTEGNEVETIDSSSMKRTSGSYTLNNISTTFTKSEYFSSASSYIITGSYTDADTTYETLTAAAKWTTSDGTTVTGESYTFSHNDATATTLLSQTAESEEG